MVRIVLADDSVFLNKVLKESLESVKDFSVVGVAENGREAIELVKALKPDVLILDCEMPVMNGLEALKIIMRECPVPVFMFSSLTADGSAVTIRALEYGAFDFLLKPVRAEDTLDSVLAELIRKIRFVVLKGKFAKLGDGAKPFVAAEPASKIKLVSRKIDIIAIGSSIGGVQAAMDIMPKLLKNMPPIVWVQHMPPIFTKNLAERLDSASGLHVKEAEDGEELRSGTCYLARGGFQMRVKKSYNGFSIDTKDSEKAGGLCPSCNVLFESVAENFSNNALGVILTGMGDDGTDGLVAMHSRGAYVLGQDARTSAVYGMPKSAFNAGAVDVQLALEDMASGIIQIAGKNV